MVATKQTGKPIDFSIMPSFHCNLKCWFCMYDASPDNHMTLDFEKTKVFLEQFDWSMINAFGFYGGEPSIEMPLYDKFIALIPESITNKFVITNGSWSKCQDESRMTRFLHWCTGHRFHIIVSGTPEHQQYQDRFMLEGLHEQCPEGIELKPADEIHAQGRAAKFDWVQRDCKFACQRTDRNIRLGLKPDGNIVYQNCHGEYHVVQSYNDPFKGILERVQAIKRACAVRRDIGVS